MAAGLVVMEQIDWLRKSCDISTWYLSPNGNPEKHGRPMKSAISQPKHMLWVLKRTVSMRHVF